MTDKPELLPCPFCGKEPQCYQDGLDGSCFTWCNSLPGDCPRPKVENYTMEAAIAAWNTRWVPEKKKKKKKA